MKLKNAVKHQYLKYMPIVLMYEALIIVLEIAYIIGKEFKKFQVEFSLLIYFTPFLLLVLGIIFYKYDLKSFAQVGVSRQTAHWSFVLILPIVIPMTIVDMTAMRIGSGIPVNVQQPFGIDSMFPLLACCYMLAFSFGRFIGALSYRLKTIQKVIVFFFIPMLLILLGTLFVISYGQLADTLMIFLWCFIFGSFGGSVSQYNMIISSIVMTVILLSFSHLLIRKAEIKTI